MATYIALYTFTDHGIKNVKDTVKRMEAAKEAAAALGVHFKEVLWTQGQYDFIVIAEALDEMAITAYALNIGKLGNLRGQTLRAFTAAEITRILEHVA